MLRRKVVPFPMAFTGFNAAGIDLLQLNRLQNSKEFYEAHKDEIKRLAIQPFYELIEEMTPTMLAIDSQFVVTPSRMVSRVRRDTRYTKDKTLYRANLWLFFRSPRRERESVPCYYFEVHPEYWAFGCWGAWGRARWKRCAMILHEDKLFQDVYRARSAPARRCGWIGSCISVEISGCSPPTRLGLTARRSVQTSALTMIFSPVLDRSFVGPMVDTISSSRRFTGSCSPPREAGAGRREALVNEVCCADFETGTPPAQRLRAWRGIFEIAA